MRSQASQIPTDSWSTPWSEAALRELRAMASFVEKGVHIMISYCLGFLLRCLYVLSFVSAFYPFGRIFVVDEAAGITQYGGDCVAFVLIGFTFAPRSSGQDSDRTSPQRSSSSS